MTPTVLIDTNVLLDWLVFRDRRVLPLTDAVRAGTLRWVVSQPMIDELEHVLTREQIAAWEPDRPSIAAMLAGHAVRLEAVSTPCWPTLRCTDPDDQKFLDLALHTGARWLVSRDKALLRLARRAAPLGLAIVTPEAWAA